MINERVQGCIADTLTSLFNSLFFVERFVEKMLSLKYLIFNTSFIIFNNSTKLYAI